MDNLINNVKDKKNALDTAIFELEHAIYDNIDKMPDNPNIVRNGKSFTITSNTLLAGEAVWSVYFHDWKAQLEDIKLVVHDALNGSTTKLNILLDDKKIMHDLRLEKVHPEVINAVSPILSKLRMSLNPVSNQNIGLD